ncbi:MAG: hypothetical protein ABW007_18165 [Chitinophagaceae bacterium]
MKMFLLASGLIVLSASANKCGSKKSEGNTYKARLETKALCMNYTLTLLEGNIDTSLINSSWTDESKGKSFANAFGLANPCDFPSTINEGDEFFFTIDTAKDKDCAVCMAYYPTPPRKLTIKVVPQ